ncbi:MAG: hypothetical protein WCW16_01570 [Candidatus Magasanikbacteria bacterium]
MPLKPSTKSPFERYQDPTGEFSNKTLKFATWYVEHKIVLRKLFIAVLSVWSVITIGIGLFVWGKYLLFDYTKDEQLRTQLVSEQINYENVHALQQPKDLIVRNQHVFNSAKDKYDFVIEATNPNEDWVAKPSYRFNYGGGQTETLETTLLPGQTRYIVAYGQTSPRPPSSAQFDLVDTKWTRLNPHGVPEPLKFIAQRLQFSVGEPTFLPATGKDGRSTHLITFDISNDSLFSYWDGDFNVLYYDENGEMTGVALLRVNQFRAGEKRTISLASLSDEITVDVVKIEPLVNVFDKNAYMPLR